MNLFLKVFQGTNSLIAHDLFYPFFSVSCGKVSKGGASYTNVGKRAGQGDSIFIHVLRGTTQQDNERLLELKKGNNTQEKNSKNAFTSVYSHPTV